MPELGSYLTAIYLNLLLQNLCRERSYHLCFFSTLDLVKNSSVDSKINIAIADEKDSFHISKIRLPHGYSVYF